MSCLNSNNYLDIIDQATGEDERELPDLPDQPDESTAVPSAVAKQATKVFQKGVTFSDPALQPRSKIAGKQALTPADWKPSRKQVMMMLNFYLNLAVLLNLQHWRLQLPLMNLLT